MKIVVSVVSVLTCALSLDAQIVTTLNHLPDGSDEVRIRNNSVVSLVAYSVGMSYVERSATNHAPFIFYVDVAIDPATASLPPNGERAVKVLLGSIVENRATSIASALSAEKSRKDFVPLYGEPIVMAGIFADGSTTGDAGLLTRLMLRRSSMLLAVETALEALSEAGRQSWNRYELISQFRKMTDSLHRWYLSPEQQIGLHVYQPIVGKLINMPGRQDGSPDPLATFIREETAMLRLQRVTLSESQPSLADVALLGR